REVVARFQRDVQARVNLPAPMDLEGAVGDLDDLGGLDALNGRDDLAAVLRAAALDGDLSNGAIAPGLDRVHGHDGATRAGDGGRYLPEHPAGTGRERDVQGQRELCGCGGHRGGSYEG